jgi:hypothetical protein
MTSAGKDSPRQGKAGVALHWSTIAFGVVTALLLLMTVNLARSWHATGKALDALEAERATLVARNLVLERAAAVLQNQKFQVCNKSADTLTVGWLAAAYHDGRQLRLFDSSRCPGWRPQVLGPGDAKTFTSSSAEEECNWGGTVMFYALNYVRESEEYLRSYNDAGRWAGFDRDCYTVE